jgi:5-methylthioribose kinase
MQGFVDLEKDPQALEAALVGMGLTRPGERPQLHPLTGGVSSNIFRIDLPRGSVCLKQALPQLKVQKEWKAPVSRVLAEMDWLQAAHAVIPGNVPRVVATDRERGVFVMEYIDGAQPWKRELLAGTVDTAFGERVARCVAAVHRATARSADMQRRFANDGTFYLIRLEPYLVETARVHPDLARQLIAVVATTQSTPLALVHGDVSPKNILQAAHGPVLLDAECAWYGDPAFDLAFLLNHVLLKSAHLPARGAAFSALFDTMARAYLADVSWEPADDFDRRCAALLPGLLLARVDGKSPVEYLDEPTREEVRRAARALVLDTPRSLRELHARWLERERVNSG